MNAALRHRCRNPRCKLKLPAPVENEHHAFCCQGCYDSFHLNRCRVCERDLRKDGKRGDANRLYCRPPADCQQEARKWPEKYGYRPPAVSCTTSLRSAHSTGLKIGITGARWGGDPDRGDHSLYDKDGLTAARGLRLKSGRYVLLSPVRWPGISWPNLEEAKRGAELVMLSAKRPPRVKQEPNPMGPPLNRQPTPPDAAVPSNWKPTGWGLAPEIPELLRRAR